MLSDKPKWRRIDFQLKILFEAIGKKLDIQHIKFIYNV